MAARIVEARGGVMEAALDRGRLDRAERAATAERVLRGLGADLDAVHAGRLDREGRVDRDLARRILEGAADALRRASKDEAAVVALAGDAPAVLPFSSPDAPDRAALARLAAAVPAWFAPDAPLPPGAATADPDDLRAAARRARQAAGLLRRRGVESEVLVPGEGDAWHRAAEDAAARAEAFAKRLEDAAAGERPFHAPAGREEFVALLRLRHGVDASPEDLEAAGAALLRESTAALEALAADAFPGRTWRQALDEVRADHPDAAGVAPAALAAAEEARAFCLERGLVTIPPEARLGHVEIVGDDMARSYPFAAYSFREERPEGESGRYMVSPGATWMTPEQREERLRGACRAWTRAVAPHETWPGHHLQFWVADHETSALRRAAGTPVFVEGWGFYCESLLEEHGYFRSPAERLCLLAMRAWRGCRVILDARLHCGGCTPEEGVAFLVENAGLTRDAATAEVRRYMENPTQPFSYAWGRGEILRLRADERRRLGEAFSERAFHDRLLRCGPIPFPFVRRLFGYEGGPADGASSSR